MGPLLGVRIFHSLTLLGACGFLVRGLFFGVVIVREKIREVIIDTLEEYGLKPKKMILFGSRAREDYREDSDWDVLVVVDRKLTRKEKMSISSTIRKRLADIYIDCDLILKSEEEVEFCKNLLGTVTREALREGVLL
ncbi:MAG TPA: nucleotidyltransferase domain-containing protein [Thermosulfidibacter takaii]|uniref:Nucleotidyltransferase domain-containing protein n=1 Tax=Thermosulfidibacter takaii TaxID=412593 RepID=A0A7C0U6C2_9BACT|nr:nucleotidyltransferase domain-containing protein [Thermosulfidibacter takaii]